MAKRYYTLPVKEAAFPLLSSDAPRSVMQNSEGAGAGIETPGVIYCHNVVPTVTGLDSVGFLQVIPPYSPVTSFFSDTRIIYGSNRSRISVAFATDGSVYVIKKGIAFWRKVNLTAPANSEDITVGTVNGISYLFFKGSGCYTYSEASGEFIPVTLTGLSIPDIIGVTSSYGYLIAYTRNTIAWSSLIDPTDFVPSLTTGAGGGSVADIDGDIRFILPNSLGMLIYSYANVVAGTYTGNSKYPFKYRGVDGGKGGLSLDATAYEANFTGQFVYTKAGLQVVDSQKAEVILPEVTDFLAGTVFEDFDEVTKAFTTTNLTSSMLKKVKFIASRYLVISYGITSFTHALIYDVALKRLGKIKLTHVDSFEYIADQEEVSKESIAFLLNSGEVFVLDFSPDSNASGVIIFGKLQYTRSRLITLYNVDIENVKPGDFVSVSSLVSRDGKTTSEYAGYELAANGELRTFGFRVTGVNHSILVIGRFSINTLYITYTLAGRR